jgi:hypothetical protein
MAAILFDFFHGTLLGMNALKAGLFRTWLNAMPDEDARGAYDPEAVLDDAWNSLTPERQAHAVMVGGPGSPRHAMP